MSETITYLGVCGVRATSVAAFLNGFLTFFILLANKLTSLNFATKTYFHRRFSSAFYSVVKIFICTWWEPKSPDKTWHELPIKIRPKLERNDLKPWKLRLSYQRVCSVKHWNWEESRHLTSRDDNEWRNEMLRMNLLTKIRGQSGSGFFHRWQKVCGNSTQKKVYAWWSWKVDNFLFEIYQIVIYLFAISFVFCIKS